MIAGLNGDNMQLESDYNPNWVDDEQSAGKASETKAPKPPEMPYEYDPLTYKAFGNFTGIYEERQELLLQNYKLTVGRTALLVLTAIANRCAGLGTCFKLSQNYLMKHARTDEDGVKTALVLLGDELGWIRQHATFMPARNRTQIDWQVSPFTIWIAAPVMADAIGLWRVSQPLQTDHFFEHTESRTSLSRRFIQNRDPVRYPDQSHKGKGDYKKIEYVEIPIEKCRQPLKNTADEAAAHEIRNVCKTHLSQARQMAATYGAKAVYAQLVKLTERQTSETIYKPGGALLAMLRREHGKPADHQNGSESAAPVLDFREL